MKYAYALIFVFLGLPVLSSCIDSKKEAMRIEVESVDYFEGGYDDNAVESARKLAKYDLDGSNYLLGQYAIYAAGKHGGNFSSGLNGAYEGILSIDIDAHPSFSSQYLVAKTFSWMYLRDDSKARDFFTSTCRAVMRLDANPCAWFILRKFGSSYLMTHERLDAVSLYEASRVTHDLNLADSYLSSFFMAIALIRMDPKESNDMIKNLELTGHFNLTMKSAYCQFIRGESEKNDVVDCSGVQGK